jgi:hypothetical protein
MPPAEVGLATGPSGAEYLAQNHRFGLVAVIMVAGRPPALAQPGDKLHLPPEQRVGIR